MSDQRDTASDARDADATGHEDRAAARDSRADAREERAGGRDVAASADRAAARRDRRRGADDRRCAALDRRAARADRVTAAEALATTAIDGLTGAFRRDNGTLELEREASRAIRTRHRFVVAFIDVVALKATNDRLGHAAGDQVLRHVADEVRSSLRSYDLLVRFGGDEFVAGLVDMTIPEARTRFAAVNALLTRDCGVTVTVGLAELRPPEAVADVIARADSDLYRQRTRRAPAAR
jgi:diguanylate cyclase (GGDEF)-like protein